MRTRGALMLSLVITFVLLSAFVSDRGRATQHVGTGTVTEVHAGEWMMVANESMRLPVALRETTYEGSSRDIRPGSRVTVWYRIVAERRPVADKVRVLGAGQGEGVISPQRYGR